MKYPELWRAYQDAAVRDRAAARRVAEAYLRRARRARDGTAEGEGLVLRGEAAALRGDLRAAAAAFDVARTRFVRAGDRRRALHADVSAVQALARLGDGRRTFGRIASMRRARANPLERAHAEMAIASALQALGREREAEEGWRRAIAALARMRKPPAPAAAASARLNLGVQLARRGAVAAARRELERALAFFEGNGMPLLREIARHDLGWVRGIAGETASALEEVEAAARAFAAQGDERRAALARLDAAELHLRLGSPEAGPRAREAARALLRCGARTEAATALLVSARSGHRASARRAREWFLRARSAAGAASASVALGEDLARAEATLRRSGHLLGALEAALARASGMAPAACARLLQERGRRAPPPLRRMLAPEIHRARAAAGGPDALRHLRAAVRAAEGVRVSAPAGSLRAHALDRHLGAYQSLARALIERGRPRDLREAFLVLDAARSRTLRDETGAGASADVPLHVRDLRARVEELWRALESRESDPGSLRGAERSLLREVDLRERELARELAALPAAAAEAGAELPHASCLAYSVVGRDVVGLLSSEGNVRAWSCGSLSRLRSLADAFAFQVSRRLFGGGDVEHAERTLAALAQRLLPGDLPEGPLTVILPPVLGGVPLEAMRVSGEPLLAGRPVAHAPAALGRVPAAAGKDALLVGIEDDRLPEVARELASVESKLGGATVSLHGAAATRDALLRELPGKRLVHVAGHAHSRADLPPLSALRLRDGFLVAADLRGRALKGALVVLSGCRTGDPSLRWHGESMGGFPRSLLAAGATAVVASRWPVHDARAREWMGYFYESLDGADVEHACARASLRMRESNPHPADWAAFLPIRGGCIS